MDTLGEQMGYQNEKLDNLMKGVSAMSESANKADINSIAQSNQMLTMRFNTQLARVEKIEREVNIPGPNLGQTGDFLQMKE
eukprot:41769-Ditylum_brightwellii.AAC.1